MAACWATGGYWEGFGGWGRERKEPWVCGKEKGWRSESVVVFVREGCGENGWEGSSGSSRRV